MSHGTPRRRLFVLLLAVTLAVPAIVLSPDPASAQTCVTQRDHPLFISSVDIRLVEEEDPDDDDISIVTPENAAFLHDGDRVNFKLTIENIVDPECSNIYNPDNSNDLQIRVQYLPNASAPHPDGIVLTKPSDQVCGGSLQPGDAACTPTVSLPRVFPFEDGDRRVTANNQSWEGEQRVRFIIEDTGDGDDDGARVAAERILVVGLKPDLSLDSVGWNPTFNPFEDRHTTYGGIDDSSFFDANVTNAGTYPNWNPNGGNQYANRSGYDDNDPNQIPERNFTPDRVSDDMQSSFFPCTFDGADNDGDAIDAPGPAWQDDDNNDGTTMDPGEMVCSYRRGQKLDMPIHWAAYRIAQIPGGDEERIFETEDVNRTEVYSDESADVFDKNNAIAPGDTLSVRFEGIPRRSTAGEFELEVDLDADPTVTRDSWTPEPDDDESQDDANNDNFDNPAEITIFGVDLKLVEHRIIVEGQPLCTVPDDPCAAGSTIRVDPRFENVGDTEVNGIDEVMNRAWNATVTVQVGSSGDETIMGDHDGDEVEDEDEDFAVFQHNEITRGQAIPNAEDSDAPFAVFPDPIRNASHPKGGEHKVCIRLDQPIAYYGEDYRAVTEPDGRVGEHREDHTSPTDIDGDGDSIEHGSNTFCLTLYFKDETDPVVEDLGIAQSPADPNDVPVIREGQNATFQANVSDNSVQTVDAVFHLPNGNTTERPMHRNHSQQELWEVNQSFSGDEAIGDYTFEVVATDSGDNTGTAVREFQVEPLATNVSIAAGQDILNGEPNPEQNPPTYRGNVSAPNNVFNVTANISGTGQDDSPEGKQVIVHRPNGTPAARFDMEDMTVCTRFNAAGGQAPNGFGQQCDPNADPTLTIGSTWTWWYVDNAEDENDWLDQPPLRWVGQFNVTVEANDTFGRSARENWTVELLDRINDNGLREANVTGAELSKSQVPAGDTFNARAHVKDVLQVERVFLNVTHEGSGDTFEADLPPAPGQIDEQETMNGTYRDTFTAGSSDAFARAGSYQVTLVAEDFGNNQNRTELGTLEITDEEPPSIDAFFTEPEGTAELGDNITWTARITDDSSIQPPELEIVKGDGSSDTVTLTEAEATDTWTFTLETSSADPEGTWTYELTVSDFAGHQVTQDGELLVVRNAAPRALEWKPDTIGPDGVAYGNTSPTISVQIQDNQEVVRDSIKMRVDGDVVFENGSGAADIEEIPAVCEGCYRLTYTPAQAFDDEATVTAEIMATDNSPQNLTSKWQAHPFKVDGSPPTASIAMTPSLTGGSKPVVGSSTAFNVSVEDAGSGPGKARVRVEHLAGTTAATQQVIEIEGASGTFRLPTLEKAFDGHGDYLVTVTPTDAVGNEGDTVQRRVLFDAVPPKILRLPALNKPPSFLRVNVTDDSRVDEVLVRFSADDGPTHDLSLEFKNEAWVGRIVDPEDGTPYQEDTEIEFRLVAKDIFGNVAETNRSTFTTGNAVPRITIDSPTEGQTLQGTVDVRWTATDEETAASDLAISLWYKLPDGQPKEIEGASDLENRGRHQLDTTLLPNGDLELQAIVFDGDSLGSDTVNVTVRNLGQAFSSPEIRDADTAEGKNVVAPGEDTLFTVQIDGNVRVAWANVTRDGEVVESYQLEDAGGGTWQTRLTAPSEEGEYRVNLAALTADGPRRTDDAYAFTVQSGEDGKSFVPEWTILSVLFAGAVAVGAFGLSRRWT